LINYLVRTGIGDRGLIYRIRRIRIRIGIERIRIGIERIRIGIRIWLLVLVEGTRIWIGPNIRICVWIWWLWY
jgi:hypothetical protein